MEQTMQNQKLYLGLGIALLLVGLAAFITGRLINGEPPSGDQVSNVTPAPEIPTTTPEVMGLLVERKDNVLTLQIVSFDPGSGWRLGESTAPMDASSGPKVEVVITKATTIYREDFEFHLDSVQQKVAETTLDYIDSEMLITVWGPKDGERVVAEILLAQHLK
jgi:hypothetical protein